VALNRHCGGSRKARVDVWIIFIGGKFDLEGKLPRLGRFRKHEKSRDGFE
jgi:hypothetical protein